jgi:hypothetical protein
MEKQHKYGRRGENMREKQIILKLLFQCAQLVQAIPDAVNYYSSRFSLFV